MITFKGIQIDPAQRTIKDVQIESGRFKKQIQEICRSDTIEVLARHSKGRRLLLAMDEDARIKAWPLSLFGMELDPPHGPIEELCGPVVVLGEPDDDMNIRSLPPWCTIETVTRLVTWDQPSHGSFPERWLVKIRLQPAYAWIDRFEAETASCYFVNAHALQQYRFNNPCTDVLQLQTVLEKKGLAGHVGYKLGTAGFPELDLIGLYAELGMSEIPTSLIESVMERARNKVAAEALQIAPAHLFSIQQRPLPRIWPDLGWSVFHLR